MAATMPFVALPAVFMPDGTSRAEAGAQRPLGGVIA
jgi:hypothetical protein